MQKVTVRNCLQGRQIGECLLLDDVDSLVERLESGELVFVPSFMKYPDGKLSMIEISIVPARLSDRKENNMFESPQMVSDFMYEKLNMCVCFEMDEVIIALKDFLNWTNGEKDVSYSGKEQGVFYLLEGVLDRAGLIEHGSSSRYPWLTPMGKDFLDALNKYSVEEIDGK